jgi:hypothetical protein
MLHGARGDERPGTRGSIAIESRTGVRIYTEQFSGYFRMKKIPAFSSDVPGMPCLSFPFFKRRIRGQKPGRKYRLVITGIFQSRVSTMTCSHPLENHTVPTT